MSSHVHESPKSVLEQPAFGDMNTMSPRGSDRSHRSPFVTCKSPPNKNFHSFSPYAASTSTSFPKPPLRRTKSLPNILPHATNESRTKQRTLDQKQDQDVLGSLPLFWFLPAIDQQRSGPRTHRRASSIASSTPSRQRKKQSSRASKLSTTSCNGKKHRKSKSRGSINLSGSDRIPMLPMRNSGNSFLHRVPPPLPLPLTPQKSSMDYNFCWSSSLAVSGSQPSVSSPGARKVVQQPRNRVQSTELQGLSFVEDDEPAIPL